jgi:imidazolonepropionase-like amidohydrolase
VWTDDATISSGFRASCARVYPGLIDAGSYAGVRRDRDETSAPYATFVRAIDAIDASHPAFAASLDEGFTALHVVLGDRNVVGGATAVVKVGSDGALRVLSKEAAVKVSLDRDAYPGNREPTTSYGALAAMRQGDGAAGEARAALAATKAPLFVAARTDRDVRLVRDLGTLVSKKPIAVSTLAASEALGSVLDSLSGVVLEPFGYDATPALKAEAARLFQASTPFAFASLAPTRPPTATRLAAIAARSFGAEEARVERALTADAAALCGVADRVGSIAPGKDGDLCVFTESPADPRARLLLVVQDGRVVRRAKER